MPNPCGNQLPPLRLELKWIKDWNLKLRKVALIAGCDYKTVDMSSGGNHRIFGVCT